MVVTENERLLLEYLRSGTTSEEVSESHEALMMIDAICEENKKHRGFELVVSNPAKSRPPKGFDREDGK